MIVSQVLVLQVNVVILSRLPCNGQWLNGLRNARNSQSMNTTRPALDELAATALRIGLLSFGGPAGQIALMHRILVDEKKWLGEKQFLHALNFCILLPGPEAMQLATYSGWLVRGIGGGLVAGLLFILPGAFVVLALSAAYAAYGDLPIFAGLILGLKAAVLAIVVQALTRVGRRALKGNAGVALAVASFLGLAAFHVPFPLVIACAAVAGLAMPGRFSSAEIAVPASAFARPWRHLSLMLGWAMLLWLLPLALMILLVGRGNVFVDLALFFSQAAIVTFGGAYAVLAYVGQQAVEHHHWLAAGEMLTGLGFAETTPGPLILVLVFVGFLGAFRNAGFADPMLAGLLGGMVTLWFTFVPCFIWVFAGAPFIERLRGNRMLSAALAAITAAIVGVIANLSVWFGLHVLFRELAETVIGPASLEIPVLASLDWPAAAIAIVAGLMVWRGAGLFIVLLVSIGAGLVATGFAP